MLPPETNNILLETKARGVVLHHGQFLGLHRLGDKDIRQEDCAQVGIERLW
jgi:hypothetical protein